MHILVAIRISWLWWSYLPRISFFLHLDAIHHFPFNLTLGLGVHNLGRFTRAIIKAMEFPMALFDCICFALRWCSSWPFHCRNRWGKGKGHISVHLIYRSLTKAKAIYTVSQINLLRCKFSWALVSHWLSKLMTNHNGALHGCAVYWLKVLKASAPVLPKNLQLAN